MTEHIASVWDALSQIITNKATSVFVASGVIISSQAASTKYINIAEDGFLWFTYSHWMTIIGCLWICILIAEKIGIFKLISWLFKKMRARKNEY